MWVVFRKSDKSVVGMSAHAKRDLKKTVAIRQVVQGLVQGLGGKLADFDAVQVEDKAEARALINVGPGQEIVFEAVENGKSKPKVRQVETFSLSLQTNITDHHPVDSVPLIPADGTSVATITLQKIDAGGTAKTRNLDNDELWLRTDHGTIQDGQGAAIRNLNLQKGTASFQLKSETALRVATVEVLSADPNLESNALRVEFI